MIEAYPLDAIVGRCLEIAKDGRWLPGTIELQMVQALAAQRNEIARLRSALSATCDGTAQIDIDAATEVTMNLLTNKLTRTAPRRIWLQCSDEPDGVRNSFGDHDVGEVTWCADSALAAEVEYVRADLVRAAMPINANDPELCALAELLGMTANT